jgi:hypothetical protein
MQNDRRAHQAVGHALAVASAADSIALRHRPAAATGQRHVGWLWARPNNASPLLAALQAAI